MEKTKIKYNEMIFVLYIWLFALARPILQENQEQSTIILFGTTGILIICNLYFNKFYFAYKQLVAILIMGLFLALLLIDLLFRSNDFTMQFLYEFIIYAVIPVYLFSFVGDYKWLLKSYSYVSCIVFFMYILDPFNEYSLSETYMNFSFLSMLPAYYGLYIGRRIFNFIWMLPLEICALISLVVFGNKGATFAVIVFVLLMNIFLDKKSIKTVLKYISVFCLLLISLLNLSKILTFVYEWLLTKGYVSYALKSLKVALDNDLIESLSGRDIIWGNALVMIGQNPFFGKGVGAFEHQYTGQYTHNLIFDILIFHGFSGFLLYSLLWLFSLKRIINVNYHQKITGVLLLCMWFPKLITSEYFFKEPGFWLFIYFGIVRGITLETKGKWMQPVLRRENFH